ncbi:hypothetical protein GJAV_G00263480 [Gymnothorax javanicus]|nr:hypothetical protein GJAV_G00263480 [Gymnothorax javanicus]
MCANINQFLSFRHIIYFIYLFILRQMNHLGRSGYVRFQCHCKPFCFDLPSVPREEKVNLFFCHFTRNTALHTGSLKRMYMYCWRVGRC